MKWVVNFMFHPLNLLWISLEQIKELTFQYSININCTYRVLPGGGGMKGPRHDFGCRAIEEEDDDEEEEEAKCTI